jgi:hypothetical protein
MKKLNLTLLSIATFFISTLSYSQELVHYWNFNNDSSLTELLTANVSLVSGSSIIHIPGGISSILSGTGQDFPVNNYNARNGDTAGSHLRFNDPIGGEIEFALPTTGYTNVVVSFATRRSGSGAGTQYWSYSIDGTNFTLFDSIFPSSAGPELKMLNFIGITGVDDNADFKLRVAFAQGQGGTVGNNRFDNFTLDANPLSVLIHYWNFNDNSTLSNLLTPTVSIVPTAVISHIPGGISSILSGTGQDFPVNNYNARNGDTAGSHLRFNDPIGGELEFTLPTTGYENIVIQFSTRRSGSGAGTQYWSYSTDGTNFILFDSIFPSSVGPELKMLDFRGNASVEHNANFKLRVAFAQGQGGTVGNNRFDNVTVESIAPDLTGKVTGVSVSPNDIVLEVGNDETLIATVTPSDALDLLVVWSSANPSIATVDSNGKVTAIAEGNTKIYVTTNDGGFMDSCKVMVTVPSSLDLIYYWHFNNFNPAGDVTMIEADYSLLNNVTAKFEYTLTPDPNINNERDIDRYSPGTLLNVQQSETAGGSARVRNPSVNRSLVFDVPTTGVSNIVFSYAVQRSNNGMLTNTIEYSIDGNNFIFAGLTNNTQDVTDFEVWQVHTYDFSSIAGVNNNPKFKIRITWSDANASNNSGNNRYDNITIMGDGTNASVAKINPSNSITIYPNPGTGVANIHASKNQPIQYVSVIDVNGRVVLESKKNVIDMSSFHNGVYFIMTTIDGVTHKNKYILNK